jgi:DNA-binding transcriptional LysR family regulator
MDSKQIEYILAIAEEKSFTKAAERLFLSQSALSQQVAKLKKEGLPPLFTYTNGEVVLTDAGKIYVHGAYQIQKIQQDTETLIVQAARNSERPARLYIALCTGMKQQFYERVLLLLHRQYPDLEIDIVSENVKKARELFTNGDLNLIFYYTREMEEDDGTKIILNQEELVVAYSMGSEANELPLILPPDDTYLRGISNFAIEEHSLKDKCGIETADLSSCIPLIQNGAYAALLPRDAAINAGLAVKQFDPPIEFYLHISFSKGRHSQFLADVCDMIRASFY